MPLDLEPFDDVGLSQELLESLIAEHQAAALPGFERLWAYYRNPMQPRPLASHDVAPSIKPYTLAQEKGLPARLRKTEPVGLADDRADTRELVIENDIAWRIDSMVDFVFGKPMRIVSTAQDETKRREIETILDAVWEASGGIALLQDMGLLGSVFGSVDLVLRAADLFEAARKRGASSRRTTGIDRALDLARLLRIEIVEARRAVPLLDPGDFRRLLAYIIHAEVQTNELEESSTLARVLGRLGGSDRPSQRKRAEILEILSPAHSQVYEGDTLIDEAPNLLGVLPVVHVQNASQPFRYEGLSDVEPLIPIQDELNTRLSDRAHRVTMQSFNLYLAKGLEGFSGDGNLRVSPGQIWHTDNPDASVEAFGGDGQSPSEDAHVEQLRDAMDKISGVSPVAIGVIRARLGHLSSENALRIALMGVLSKTARKRIAYGRGISEMSALVLRALDISGAFRTGPSERSVRLEWDDPLPIDERARLRGAVLKQELGVPRAQVLSELGYGADDDGVT
jgi:hypothetical protein